MVWPTKFIAMAPALLAGGGYCFFSWLAGRQPGMLIWFGLAALMATVVAAEPFLFRLRRQKLTVYTTRVPLYYLAVLGFAMMIFADRSSLRFILMIVNSFLIFLEVYLLFLFTSRSVHYPTKALEQVNIALIFLSLFYFFGISFGWLTFLANNFWTAMLAAAIFSWPLYWTFFILRPLEGAPRMLMSLILSLLTAEMLWGVGLWPMGFLARAWALMALVVLAMLLCLWWFAKKWQKRRVIGSVLITMIAIAVILIAVRWV